jgi:peroxiredoxin
MRKSILLPIIALLTLLATDAGALGRRNNLSAPAQDTVKLDTGIAKERVEEYLKELQFNHTDTILAKVNNLILRGENEQTRSFLAYTAYNFFYNSKLMGQEGIAVKIAQEWFLNDRLPWPNEEGKFLLRTFVEFNRHSLIGMEAPQLELQDTLGERISLNSIAAEYTIVYFYSSGCSSCKVQTPQLVDFVNGYEDGVLAVYAVYADSNENEWKSYINENLHIYNPFVFWHNVYDPDFSSGFHMLYNVIKTPQMFLLDKEKRIIGRGLDTDALKELLEKKNEERNTLYQFLGSIFSPIKENREEVFGVIDLIAQRSMDDTDTFRDIMGGMFQWLAVDEEYTLQEGAAYLAEKYIVNLPDKWSGNYVEKMKRTVDAFNKNKLGEKAADLQLERVDKSPINIHDISSELKVLYFYRPNCGMCSQVTPKMAVLHNEFKEKLDIQFLAINLGGGYREWIEYTQGIGADWENLRGSDGDSSPIYAEYHLENIPAIYLLINNIVVAKGINEIDLKEILNNIKP